MVSKEFIAQIVGEHLLVLARHIDGKNQIRQRRNLGHVFENHTLGQLIEKQADKLPNHQHNANVQRQHAQRP